MIRTQTFRCTFVGGMASHEGLHDARARHHRCPGRIALSKWRRPEGLLHTGATVRRLIDGRSVVKRSTTPFCTAARALLAEGIDSATRLGHAP